jgi:hypothetical protein
VDGFADPNKLLPPPPENPPPKLVVPVRARVENPPEEELSGISEAMEDGS